jgi:hypothetical protein
MAKKAVLKVKDRRFIVEYYADLRSKTRAAWGTSADELNCRCNAMNHLRRENYRWCLIKDRYSGEALWTLYHLPIGIDEFKGDRSPFNLRERGLVRQHAKVVKK